MPQTWWGKGIMFAYAAGWWVYLALAGYWAWPRMGFWDWQAYMGFQAAYALLWPVWVALSLAGVTW
jgi:hypothetical protein